MGKTSLGVTGRRFALFAASALCFYACGDSDTDGITDDGGDAGEAGEVSAGRSGGSAGRAGGGGGAQSGAGRGGALGGTPIDPGSAGDGGTGEGGTGEGGTAAGGTTAGTNAGGPSGGTTPGAAGEGGAGGDTGGAPEGGAAPGGAGAGGAGGVGGAGGESGEGGSGGAPFVEFCADLGPIPTGVSQRRCFDFSVPGDATGWSIEDGAWAITEGAYVGTAEENDAPTCNAEGEGSAILTATAPTVSASNVRVHARMWNIQGSDKVVVLRGADAGDRIELNFRSNFENDQGGIEGGDLIIQSLVNCIQTGHVAQGQVEIPHEQADILDVDIELVAQTLRVTVNGSVVYNNQAPLVGPPLTGTLATAPGAVGFGILRYGGIVAYDNLLVEVLD